MSNIRFRAPLPTLADQWAGFTDEELHRRALPDLSSLMSGAMRRLFGVAAAMLSDHMYAEALQWGNRPGGPGAHTDGAHPTFWEGTELARLPDTTWFTGRDWRLQIARSVEDLGTDVLHGQAPVARCIAEDAAVMLTFQDAQGLAWTLMDDPDFSRTLIGMPVPPQLPADDERWSASLDFFLEEADVYLLWDAVPGFDHPDHPLNRGARVGDLRPPVWFDTFANVRPRDPSRGFPPHVTAAVRAEPLPAPPSGDEQLRDAMAELGALVAPRANAGSLGRTSGSTPEVRNSRRHVLAGAAHGGTPVEPGLGGWRSHGCWVIPDDAATAVAQAQHVFREPLVVQALWAGPDGSFPGTTATTVEVFRVEPHSSGPCDDPWLRARWAGTVGGMAMRDLVAVLAAPAGTEPCPWPWFSGNAWAGTDSAAHPW